MKLLLCLVALGVTCHVQCFNSNEEPEEVVLDLRTLYRKYLPDEFTDLADDVSESKSVNITAFEINNKNKSVDWSKKDRSYADDSDITEERRQWMKRMRWKGRDENEFEFYNSSEYRDAVSELNRKIAFEENRTDVYENDEDHIWEENKYTKPEGFPLAYSPRFMNEAYRKYSLSFNNPNYTTTGHWILYPLTGDQGIKYEKAMKKRKAFAINKHDPKRVAAFNKNIEEGMKGKDLNRTKDMVRFLIELRRRIGKQLNWRKPTDTVSQELQQMKVPDTEEMFREYEEEYKLSKEVTFPDGKELLYATRVILDTEEEEELEEKERTEKGTARTAFRDDNSSETTTHRVRLTETHRVRLTETTIKAIESTKPEVISSTVRFRKRPDFKNHTASKFLRKHKNKFLVGGIACLVLAKILT